MDGARAAQARIRRANARPIDPSGAYVLYWMHAYRRMDHNHALDHALRLGEELGKPVVVYEGLRLDHPYASARLHAFVLEGMRDNARDAERLGLSYWPFVETPERPGRGLLRKLAARAAVVVTDDFPAYIIPDQIAALATKTDAAVVAVDGNGVAPLALLGAPAPSAAVMRRRIHSLFVEAFAHRAAPRPRVPRVARARLDPPFEPWDLGDAGETARALPLRNAVPIVAGMPGGSHAARTRLDRFVRTKLRGYAEHRSEPLPPGEAFASGLSPYLHFGHVSAEAIVARVLDAAGVAIPEGLHADERGTKGFFGVDADVCAFLDELVTWRELGYHWMRHRRADTASLARALPAWATATLREHAKDRRAFLYDRAELEAGATHDPIWNAAQRELVATGTIHNYLRMLWGKSVLAWSKTPEDAYATLVALNDTYALDGRDPNSFSGILWCFGLFDRPWPERAVFGKVRAMTSASTANKFDLDAYLAYVASLG